MKFLLGRGLGSWIIFLGVSIDMAKRVTFYYGMMEGLSDYKEHKNKEEAEAYFRANYNKYFQFDTGMKGIKPPCSYGYPHRKYYCMTKYRFNKRFGDKYDTTND
jgi:hypothetical protein